MTDAARTLPHSLDAEQAILGAILLHGEVLGDVAAGLRPEQFFRDAHRRIYTHALRLAHAHTPVEFVTLEESLRASDELETVGGPAYLASLVDGLPRSTNVAHYCLAQDERILTVDLRWVPVGEITVGQRVMGFDETPTCRAVLPRRRWRIAEVLGAECRSEECVRVVLDDGTDVVCTADHPWLADGSSRGRQWVRADRLHHASGRPPADIHAVVCKAVSTWDQGMTWQSGWLAGLFDGEGTIRFGDGGGGSRLSFSQKAGEVLSAAKTALDALGFRYRMSSRPSGVHVVDVVGGLREHVRLLGTIRPKRLLRDFEKKWKPRFLQSERRRVVTVVPVGRRDIQRLTTSTGTYIGEGFLMHNCNIVREAADRRAVIAVGSALVDEAYDGEEDARRVIDRAEQRLYAIAQDHAPGGLVPIRDILPRVIEQIEAWHRSGSGVSGVSTGLTALDAHVRGFQPGQLVILAARPGMGKSAFALTIAQHVAGLGDPVALFSLEMSSAELGVRALTAAAHLDGHRLQCGWISAARGEWARLTDAMSHLDALPLYLDDAPFVTVLDIRAQARRLKRQHGLALVIVDYAQLMVGHERKENRTLELAAITRALKALAKDLALPVLALSQLNRELEKRPNKRPMLSDLRDSGALEQDADLVLFLYRDEHYDPYTADQGIAEVIIGKHRNGPPGTVKVAWIAGEMRFANLAEAAADDRQLPLGDRA